MDMSIHNVTKIELCRTFLGNGNSRTMRITYLDHNRKPVEVEICCYGQTDALEKFPRTDDFSVLQMPAKAV